MASAATSSTRPIALLLRINAKSFEPINALRAKYPVPRAAHHKEDPSRLLQPYFTLLRRLPGPILPIIQQKVSKLAALQKPFSIKVGAPVLGNGLGQRPGFLGLGFQMPVDQIEQLQRKLYAELSADIKEGVPEQYLKKFSFPATPSILHIRSTLEGFPEEEAPKILRELQELYPNGFGEIVAEAFSLQEFINSKVLRVSQDRMKGEYSFGGN